MGQRRSCSATRRRALTLLMALGLADEAQTPAKAEPLAELDGEAITAEEAPPTSCSVFGLTHGVVGIAVDRATAT
jgi:hypothetical protein